jgi:hypothetical protein
MFGAGDARFLDLEKGRTALLPSVQASDNPPFPLLFSADKVALINKEPKAITGPDVACLTRVLSG